MNLTVIWVISSDPDIRQLIALNLKMRGLHILEATPEQGIRLPDAEPQLIILDLNNMNEHDWKFARQLREIPGVDSIPIILLLSKAPTTRFLSPLQPVCWLEKPIDMNALVNSVRVSLATDNPFPGHIDKGY